MLFEKAFRCASIRISSIVYGMMLITNIINSIKIFGFSHKKVCTQNVIAKPRNRKDCSGAEISVILLMCVSVINANNSVSQRALHAPQQQAIT